jgi:hypothetical protein
MPLFYIAIAETSAPKVLPLQPLAVQLPVGAEYTPIISEKANDLEIQGHL